jgi:hypothetical protein
LIHLREENVSAAKEDESETCRKGQNYSENHCEDVISIVVSPERVVIIGGLVDEIVGDQKEQMANEKHYREEEY